MRILFKYLALGPTLFTGLISFGQEVTAKTDKAEYFSHEIIKVVFIADFKPDSTSNVDWDSFVITGGPSTINSMSTVEGKTSSKVVLTYRIKATTAGKLKIESPVFWLNGEAEQAIVQEITVLESTLTEEEIQAVDNDEFRKKKDKPMGSIRVTLDDERAYLEEYQFFGWVFKRWLTKEELESLKALKK